MTLTDLIRNTIRGTALGLVMYVTGCGGESVNRRLCQSDYDCQAPSTCGSEGYCEVPGESEGEGSPCENYCDGLMGCCEREGNSFSDLCENYSRCIDDCEQNFGQESNKDETMQALALYNSGCCYITYSKPNQGGRLICNDDNR